MVELSPATTIETQSYRSDIFFKSPSERIVLREHRFTHDEGPAHELIDIHADYWTFAIAHLEKGQVSIRTPRGDIKSLEGPTAIFLPRFSVVEFILKSGTVHWCYLLSTGPTPVLSPKVPSAFKISHLDDAMNLIKGPSTQLVDWICSRKNESLSIEKNNHPHIVSTRVKQLIDLRFREAQDLSPIFTELGFSSSAASRLFKRTYGLSPVQYRNQLRIMQAGTDLIFGAESVEKAHLGVGLEDPSYFYQRFREHMNTTPARFRISQESEAQAPMVL
ncbi:MAG: helix-turn-helix transcriptional regulator [Bdellovibrionaceae bacterium]|nr:helix-turn-helix transcriptional regulator [Pseudobdellovibrionaceae bacterium]